MKIRFIALCLSGSLAVLAGCSQKEELALPNAASDPVFLKGKIDFSLTKNQLDSLPSDFIEKAATVGWQFENGTFEKSFPLQKVELVLADGRSFTSDTTGKVALEKQDFKYLNKAVIHYDGTPVGHQYFDSQSNHVVVHSTLQDYLLQKDALHIHPGGRVEDGPMDYRCMDYNGPASDGTNYPKSNWRAYRNFVNSDCDMALLHGWCFFDHSSGGCYARHGTLCSTVIRHSSSYHKHDWNPFNDPDDGR